MCLRVFYSLLLLVTSALAREGKCGNCEVIVDKFMIGLKETKNKNFGGGNTEWEEKSLTSFGISETRLIEIIEGISKDISMSVATLLEENEELLEKWFFNEMTKFKTDADTEIGLRTFLCVDNVKVCCPHGKFGKKCRTCPVSTTNPCNKNGNCSGDGTRRGNGICICRDGYNGETCNECVPSYYAVSAKDAAVVKCKACDISCADGCTKSGPGGCKKCAEGWSMQNSICLDKNECEDSLLPCKDNEFCLNTIGSFKCRECDKSCAGCTEEGSDNCIMCEDGYFEHEDKCQACDVSCSTTCTDFTPLTCEDCKSGYEMVEGKGCVDINECLASPCEKNEYCLNVEGDFICKFCNDSCTTCNGDGADNCLTCASGYSMKDGTCTDIDECEEMKKLDGFFLCDEIKESCHNHGGGFTCKCVAGLRRDKSGICVDEQIVKDKQEEIQKKMKEKREREVKAMNLNSKDDIILDKNVDPKYLKPEGSAFEPDTPTVSPEDDSVGDASNDNEDVKVEL